MIRLGLEEPLGWLPGKDLNSKENILMIVTDKSDGHAFGIYVLNHEPDKGVWSLSYVNRYDDKVTITFKDGQAIDINE